MRSPFHRYFLAWVLAICLVHPASAQDAPTSAAKPAGLGHYSFYLGNLHAHSIYSGDLAKSVAKKRRLEAPIYTVQTPAQVLEKAKANGYDFYDVAVYKIAKKDPVAFSAPVWMDNR